MKGITGGLLYSILSVIFIIVNIKKFSFSLFIFIPHVLNKLFMNSVLLFSFVCFFSFE